MGRNIPLPIGMEQRRPSRSNRVINIFKTSLYGDVFGLANTSRLTADG